VQSFQDVVKTFYDDEFQAHPITATDIGVHDYDAEVDDLSRDGQSKNAARLHKALDALTAIDPANLSAGDRDDREMLTNSIKGNLLDVETIRYWRSDPGVYVHSATSAVFNLVHRVLRRSQIACDRSSPARGRSQCCLRPAKLISSIRREQKPKAGGDFALGSDLFAKRMAYYEMIGIPLDRLLDIAYAQLRKDQGALTEVARKVDPTAPIETVLKEIRAQHPTVDTLIPATRDELAGLRAFVLDHQIATIPGDVLPKVEETPGFRRATIAAAMDPPGPLERRATQAFYYVTPPMPGSRRTSSNNISKPITSPGSRSYRCMRFGRAISCSI